MPWTIPDKGEGDSDIQSILFQEYLEVLVAGIRGVDCVLWGCDVTGGADMTPAVAAGAVISNGTWLPVVAGDVTIGTANATNPRIDLIVVDSTGTKQVRAGTAAAAPKPPARTANDVVLAAVYVPANDTSIETTKCIDMRVFRDQGPIVVQKTTTAVVFNNSSAQNTFLTTTVPAGIPNGKILRFRMGGHYLFNSGTPTLQWVIAVAGTSQISDTTGAATADADRGAWFLEFDIAFQGASDQEFTGVFHMSTVAAKTAPTVGRAFDFVATALNSPFSAAGAVDYASLNRDVTVRFTMNVANAANEMTLQYATVELI